MRSRETPQTFVTEEPAQGWVTWHRRLGHMGYTTLQRMLDNDLVYGFQVDKNSLKPDCRACTEAKQIILIYGDLIPLLLSTETSTTPASSMILPK